MSRAGAVLVTFVDGDTGHVFAHSDMPAAQLPDSFAAETTLQLGDDSWLVERAEPLTAAEAVATGQLVLTVRRLQRVPSQEILYSLPTICDTLPPVGSAAVSTDSLELYEDDWRQVELASRSLASAINTELEAIRRIYTDHSQRDAEGRTVGFDSIHIRSISSLAEPLPWPRLRDLLPAPRRAYAGVRFRGSANLVVGSFALGFGPLTCYGAVDRERVTVLGLHVVAGDGAIPVAAIEAVLRSFDLVIIDWRRCAVVEAGHLAEYLHAITGSGGTAR